ncbi:MAG: lipoyl(octanoyl) transferase LipB [candidate division WOR-3 bacterium]
MPRCAHLINLGLTPYDAGLSLQRNLWALRIRDQIPDTLVLLEHPPSITLGKSAKAANLLLSRQELQDRGVQVFQIERGGDVTYHGPGQLVGYPVFRIDRALAGVRSFVQSIERSIIKALSVWSIPASTKPGLVGVWVNDDKIAAIGIAVRQQVVLHGFALNVKCDLRPFGYIVPCGIPDKGVTSMAKVLNREISLATVRHQVASAFESEFDLELKPAHLPLAGSA